MAREEIIEKLDKFLAKYPILNEECHVVYLLVEIRKHLESDNNPNFPLLKFYSDWTVHTNKARDLARIKSMVDKIDSCYSKASHYPINDDGIFEFLDMTELKEELRSFFNRHSLPMSILEDKNGWSEFVDTLTSVLYDQPILNPKTTIKSISLVPGGKGHSAINIEFTDGRTDSMAGGER